MKRLSPLWRRNVRAISLSSRACAPASCVRCAQRSRPIRQSSKATPLAALVTVVDLFGVADRVRQETYIIYPPLLTVMVVYMVLTFIIVRIFGQIERQVPSRR